MEAVAPLLEKFTKWAKENPKLVAAIAAVVVVLLGLLAVFGIVGAAIAAFMAIGTVGVVAAAVAAGIAILVGIFIYFGDTIKAVAKTIGRLIGNIVQWFKDNFDTIKKVVLTVLAVAFAPLIATVLVIVGVFKILVWIVQTARNIFIAVFNAIWAVVQFVFNGIMILWKQYCTSLQCHHVHTWCAVQHLVHYLHRHFPSRMDYHFNHCANHLRRIEGVFNWIVNTILETTVQFLRRNIHSNLERHPTVFNAIWNVISRWLVQYGTIVSRYSMPY